MKENNLIIKDYIQKSHLNFKVGKKLHLKYKKVFYQINNELKTPNKFFYLFNKNYKLVKIKLTLRQQKIHMELLEKEEVL